jgi:hypothetical protein
LPPQKLLFLSAFLTLPFRPILPVIFDEFTPESILGLPDKLVAWNRCAGDGVGDRHAQME